MKLKKAFCVLISMIMCVISFSAPQIVEASDYGITPYYDYTRQVTSNLAISSSGKATISIGCTGISGKVSKITAETCLQRKVGLIWVKVDIGRTNNVWTSSTTNYYLNTSYSTTLSKSGTYRAKTVFTVYNTSSKSENISIESSSVSYSK